MKVHIEGNLYLESDGMQFILKNYTGNQDKHGNELSRNVGYYTNVKSAVNALIKMKVMESTATTLKELIEDVHNIENFIKSQIYI